MEIALTHVAEAHAQLMERVLVGGDLSKLTGEQRLRYYDGLCRSLGLNPLSRPFEYVNFEGKLVLYARKDCAEQLRRLHKVSIIDLKTEHQGDLYLVSATARTPDGRTDMDQGVVWIGGQKGNALANALMRGITKAKRRVTLSLCGLGIVDETELETIPGARPIRVDERTGEILDPVSPALPAQMQPAPEESANGAAPNPERAAVEAELRDLLSEYDRTPRAYEIDPKTALGKLLGSAKHPYASIPFGRIKGVEPLKDALAVLRVIVAQELDAIEEEQEPDEEMAQANNPDLVTIDARTGEVIEGPRQPPDERQPLIDQYARLRRRAKDAGGNIPPLGRDMSAQEIRDMLAIAEPKVAALEAALEAEREAPVEAEA